jgi:hypothetical protein
MIKSGEAVMEKVRRYRATASLYRQTASFRPLQRWSLLDQAEEWERLAVEELEAYFIARNSRHDDRAAPVAGYAEEPWETTVEREANVRSMRAAARFTSAMAFAA